VVEVGTGGVLRDSRSWVMILKGSQELGWDFHV
jgi:hypothetical protein